MNNELLLLVDVLKIGHNSDEIIHILNSEFDTTIHSIDSLSIDSKIKGKLRKKDSLRVENWIKYDPLSNPVTNENPLILREMLEYYRDKADNKYRKLFAINELNKLKKSIPYLFDTS